MIDQLKNFLQRKNRVFKLILYVSIIMYSCLMIWEVFIGPYRSYSGIRRYNLYPFKTIIDFIRNRSNFGFHVLFINLAANIITFIPLGFFMSLILKASSKLKYTFRICVLIVICIELGQFILNVGVLDIDDVILNSIGCAIGITFYNRIKELLIIF
ncbi:MAG: VanZ family protein [Bacillota bacterium]|nr:VanZ family protein [Bacillota bacterium]